MKHKKQFLFFVFYSFIITVNLLTLFRISSLCNNENSYSTLLKFDTLVNRSKGFENKKIHFPTKANRIVNIADNDKYKKSKIEKDARDVRPLIHKKVKILINDFLTHKKEYGSKIEKDLYENMQEREFINRLLTNRPLMFMTELDAYILRNGTRGQGGFETIGTLNEKSPLILKEYLSYDEMQISALIGMLVPTYFINNGNRFNAAEVGAPDTYEERGIYVGVVGARFEKPELMEWKHMIITPQQNTKENGYGTEADKNDIKTKYLSIWASFYETKFVSFEEAKRDKTGRFIQIKPQMYLDSLVYKKRMKRVIKPFLVEANKSGIAQNKNVYVHVVGLGLGVWQQSSIQAKLMLEVYADILKKQNLCQISDLNFSWFPTEYQTCGGIGDSEVFKTDTNMIYIHFSKRNPADKLEKNHDNKLLVAMYAWDGNAYPGNEYWGGNLSASGDPAAACCSTIAELQNPLINSNISHSKIFWCE